MTRAPSVLQSAQALDVIEASMERDKFLNAEEAKEFGLIDEVLTSRPPTADEIAASGMDE
jgi:ATP-dependent Clp protease protease subunit